MLKQWNKGNTEKGVCMDENKESQPYKRLSHSIEEILRRPTVQRSWSVIKENSRLPQPLSCAGTLFHFFLVLRKHTIPPHFYWLVTVDMQCNVLNLSTRFTVMLAENAQIRLESPKAGCAGELLCSQELIWQLCHGGGTTVMVTCLQAKPGRSGKRGWLSPRTRWRSWRRFSSRVTTQTSTPGRSWPLTWVSPRTAYRWETQRLLWVSLLIFPRFYSFIYLWCW